ncbi:ankyrin repeat domain-containing protein [Flavivirga algicola]|uniref:Ankyrin repeat domain-containing protein n=1 Tax=Flavivirga algicola TaxID=2729136 RepID=A0ABX1RTR5_9FLAO|nr:ankyrin repeat domain-containing protein [Flavivirga algicola]NMH86556.1 ankyrin repeat domain-containing protein [Flavivirga algicola]
MDLFKEIAYQIELHSVQGIKACFEKGLDSNSEHQGKLLIDLMVGMYTRSPRFKACVELFIEYGLKFENAPLLAVLTDNAPELKKHLASNPKIIHDKISLECAYTPLKEASLLHLCAEFNHVECAKVLIEYGIDINVKAGTDENGFGGQTPIFHTVNQNNNNSIDMLDLLLSHNPDLSYTIQGIIWGKGFSWETLIPSINPISYAMFGLLPQMHRDEKTISVVVEKLTEKAYGIKYSSKNIPNQYLSE